MNQISTPASQRASGVHVMLTMYKQDGSVYGYVDNLGGTYLSSQSGKVLGYFQPPLNESA